MRRPGPGSAILTATLLAVFCVPAQAGVALELEAGLEYDSNVAVDAAETNAGIGDQAQTLRLALGYNQALGRRGNISGRYQLYDSRWQRYSAYDTRMHTGVLRSGFQHGRFSADLALIHARADVDSREFLRLNRLSPTLGWLLNRQWYFRAQTDISEKQFADFPRRDSDGLAGSLHLYRFIDRTRFYLSGSLQWKTETAADPVYSYQASSLRLQIRRDWSLAGLVFTSRLQARYEQRQYDAERTDIRAARADDRWRLGLETTLKLTPHWQLEAAVHSDRFDSNLPVADYSQQRYRLGVGWSF